MKIAQKLQFKTLLILSFLVPFILMLLMVGASIHGINHLFSDVDTIYKDRIIPIKELHNINASYSEVVVDSIVKAQVGLISAEQAKSSIISAQAYADKEWAHYLTTEFTEDERALVEEEQALFKVASRFVQQAVQQLDLHSASPKGQLEGLFPKMYDSIDLLSAKLDELIKLQLDVASELHQNSGEERLLLIEELLIALTIALVLSLFAFISIMRVVKDNVGAEPRNVKNLVRDIAKGNLEARLEGTKNVSSESIAGQIDEMKINLREVIFSVTRSALSVKTASDQLSEDSQNAIASVRLQQGDLVSTSSAMTEMEATITEIASNASNTSTAVQDAYQEVTSANKLISNNKQNLQDLLEDLSSGLNVIESLAERVQSIGSVLNVIDEISEQTNLLALNAAIEAARAGEYGRGFAVVADEVRLLAKRTNDSTNEIQEMIESLQLASKEAVGAMQRSGLKAKDNMSHSDDTEELFEKITHTVQSILDMTHSVAAAAEEQSIVVADINRNIAHIQDMGEEALNMNESVITSSKKLKDVSGSLKDKVSYFSV